MSDTIYSRPGETFYSELDNAPTGLVGTVGVQLIRKSDDVVVIPRTTEGIVESPAGSGRYKATLVAPQDKGAYTVFWDSGSITPGSTASDDLVVTYDLPPATEPFLPAGDLRDTRVLIPRARRAIEGPDAITGSAGVPAGSLSDIEVNAMVADAIAGVILLSGDLFGKELVVASRDEFYLAPDQWITSEALTEPEQMVIAYQVALDYYQKVLEGMKVSERIQDEGQEWEWSVSSTVLTKRLEGLRADRDKALEKVDPEFVAETWINTLRERDRYTDELIEPWYVG